MTFILNNTNNNDPRSAEVHFLAAEWSWALSKFCEMPEVLHCTHDSQVGLRSGEFGDLCDEVGTVGPQPVLRLTGRVSWLRLWHNFVKFKDIE